MTRIFEAVLNVSINSVWLIFAVMCARLALYKAPKWTRMMLWALVAVRLVLPFALESPLSLVHETEVIDLSAAYEKDEEHAYGAPLSEYPEKTVETDTGVTPPQNSVQTVLPVVSDKSEDPLVPSPSENENPVPIIEPNR